MCSELTPRAPIPDTRIPQLMQPWSSVSNYTPLHAGRQCWGKTILPRAGYGLGTYRTVDIFNFSLISWAILEKLRFLCFYIIKSSKKRAKMPLNLTSEGQKYPPEVRVQHETCSTICGKPVQAILDQKKLTGLAGGVREGQNNALVHIAHWNDPNVPYFDLPWPLLPTRSNFFGPKWLVQVSHI